MIHAISQAMAGIDLLPDSILLVLIALGAFFMAGLGYERDRSRRARWIPPAARPQTKPEEKRAA